MIINSLIRYAIMLFLILASALSHAQAPAKVFAYDYYLGFPLSDPKLQEFFSHNHIILQPYYNMDIMVKDLQAHRITAAFLPAATLEYLKDIKDYQGIASSTVGKDRQLFLTSYLIVNKSSSIIQIEQLQNKKIAYINTSCTTSYFAPRIFFDQHDKLYNGFFSQQVKVDGFYQQIPSLIAGTADATMVWDKIWLQDPKNAQTTRIIGKISGMPTPVVILNMTTDAALEKPLLEVLEAYKPTSKSKWLFSGFSTYQGKLVQVFLNQIEKSKAAEKPL